MDPDALTQRVDEFAVQLGSHVSDVKLRMTEEGLSRPIIARLAYEITA